MERLTKRDENGTAIAPDFADKTYIMQDEHDKFTGYINSPIVDRLAELEDKIESGKLVELRFKIGDKVYEANAEGTYRLTITRIILDKRIIYDTDGVAFDERAIGKSIFPTKEGAEVRAKEIQDHAEAENLSVLLKAEVQLKEIREQKNG